jgi:hypothetical protein
MLEADKGKCRSTNGCVVGTLEGTWQTIPSLDFDWLSTDTASWTFELPSNFTGTTAQLQVVWYSNDVSCAGDTDADDVCWIVDGASSADGEIWETKGATGTQNGVTDVCQADGNLNISDPINLVHTMAASERAFVLLRRDVSNGEGICGAGTDDYDQLARVLAVRFCYEVDNVFSGE